VEKRAVFQLVPGLAADKTKLHMGILISNLSSVDRAVALDVGVHFLAVGADNRTQLNATRRLVAVLLANTASGRAKSDGGGASFPHDVRKCECGRGCVRDQVDIDWELSSSGLWASKRAPGTPVPHSWFFVGWVFEHSWLFDGSSVK
jgi:hypothetical protein